MVDIAGWDYLLDKFAGHGIDVSDERDAVQQLLPTDSGDPTAAADAMTLIANGLAALDFGCVNTAISGWQGEAADNFRTYLDSASTAAHVHLSGWAGWLALGLRAHAALVDAAKKDLENLVSDAGKALNDAEMNQEANDTATMLGAAGVVAFACPPLMVVFGVSAAVIFLGFGGETSPEEAWTSFKTNLETIRNVVRDEVVNLETIFKQVNLDEVEVPNVSPGELDIIIMSQFDAADFRPSTDTTALLDSATISTESLMTEVAHPQDEVSNESAVVPTTDDESSPVESPGQDTNAATAV